MAQVTGVTFRTEAECLEGFARTMGAYEPRQPVPSWWVELEATTNNPGAACRRAIEQPPDAAWYRSFLAWYAEARAEDHLRLPEDPEASSVLVRLETFPRDIEEDDEEDEEDEYDEYDDEPSWADQSDNDACREATDALLGPGAYDGDTEEGDPDDEWGDADDDEGEPDYEEDEEDD